LCQSEAKEETVRHLTRIAGSAALLFAGAAALGAQGAATVAVGTVELTDPSGDVKPIVYLESVGTGPQTRVEYPPFDVVKLVASSDGTRLAFAATLTAPPGKAAYEVLEFYVDADNNPKTGITYPTAPRLRGLEYYGTLDACYEHDYMGSFCTGTTDRPKSRFAVATLEKFGREWMFKDALLDMPAAGTVKEPMKFPFTGAVVQASLGYADMGLKSGHTIRIVVREACAGERGSVTDGFFPDIVLRLK
jgi:hypothetical protein